MNQESKEVEVSRDDIKIADISLVPNPLLKDVVNALFLAEDWMKKDAPFAHPNKRVGERLRFIQNARFNLITVLQGKK